MYSWEVDNFLKSKCFKINFKDAVKIMNESPQINFWKLEEMITDIPNYGRYIWRTNDGYEWNYFIENNFNQD